MTRLIPTNLLATTLLLSAMLTGLVRAADAPATPEQVKFYNDEVRPILVKNCLKCHGGEKRIRGDLDLTFRDGVLKGGELGPAVNTQKPDASWLLVAIGYEDDDLQMPPKGKLDAAKIATLTKWVKMGAPYPPDAKPKHTHAEAGDDNTKINERTRNHWSFRPIVRPAVPALRDGGWVRNPIDAFILQRLTSAGLRPVKPADKVSLLRRAYYDLIGLPPTPAQVEAFLKDTSPDAYEKVIDQLLASPHYGEKWGRHWLDLVHYAESNSFERDNPKPDVWRYRDFVIRAFNEDMPYDQFIREQLAGDELETVTPRSMIATGYYRLGLWDDESADPPKSRWDELDDWVTVTGQGVLGLTLNCARCHSHKIDPLPQEDYYRFLAFFRDVKSFQNGRDGHGKGFNQGNFHRRLAEHVKPDDLKKYASQITFDDTKLNQLDAQLSRWDKEIADKLPGGVRDDWKFESNKLAVLKSHAKLLPKGLKGRYEKAFNEREQQRAARANADVRVLAISAERNPPVTHVQIRGNAGVNGKAVEPGFPQVLGFPEPKFDAPKDGARSAGRRTVLVDWLFDDKNPLVARVIVNRVWQHHFGRGIVASANDFGFQGDRPTHPHLLDWLASEFRSQGWSFKKLHKLIMTSSTYRLSASYDSTAYGKDPNNLLRWRFDVRRLTAEEIRDSVLTMNGRLHTPIYGKSVYPPIPREVMQGQSRPGANWPTSGEPDRYRRSIYIHVKRSLLVPMLEDFDVADTDNTCPVRFATTQPTQALGMLNSEFILDQARAFAARLRKEAGNDVRDQVAQALRLATQRTPQASEIDRGIKLIDELKNVDGISADKALEYYCLVVLNLNEFVYLD